MAGIELATAYVNVYPSMRGAQKSIAEQLGGIDTSKAGERIGSSLSSSISRSISDDALEGLNASVRAAEKRARDAMESTERHASTAAKAQQRLNDAVERYGEGSEQAADAAKRLQRAQERLSEAYAKEAEAVSRVARADEELARATDLAARSAQYQRTAVHALESSLGSLSSAAGSASRALSAAGSALSAAGGKLMGIGGTLTAGVTAPLIAAAGGVGKFALETASAAETTEISFTTMLGSAEAAESMMSDLSDFAAKTPFELSGLNTAARQLLAYGFAAEDIVPMLTDVGDATAALGTGQAGIDSVTRALGQMQTRGKVSAEEMLQLTEAGIPAWEYLARAIGTDTAGAMQAVTDGAVDASTGIAALTGGMREDFGGMMEEQSKTVEGLFSNLSDAVQRPFMELRDSEAYREFADALGEIVDAAGPFVESLLPHMERGLEAAADALGLAADAMDRFASLSEGEQADIISLVGKLAAVGPVALGAGGAMRVLGGAFNVAGTALKGVSKAAGKASSAIRKAADPVEKTAKGLDKGQKAAGLLGKGLTAVSGGLVGIAATGAAALIGALATSLADAAEHERVFEDAMGDLPTVIGSVSDEAFDLEGYVDDLASSMSSLSDGLETSLGDVNVDYTMLSGYIDTIERLGSRTDLTAREQYELQDAIEKYNQITGDTMTQNDLLNGNFDDVIAKLDETAEAWKRSQVSQAYAEYSTGILSELIESEASMEDAAGVLQDAQKAYDDAVSRLQEAPDLLVNQADVDRTRRELEEAKESYDELIDLNDELNAKYEEASNAAYLYGSNIATALSDAVMELAPEMQGLGISVAESLSRGVESGSVSAEDAAEFLASSIPAAFDMLPPSMEEEGKAAVQALADGIADGEISADDASRVLMAVITGNVDELPPYLQGKGEEMAASLGTGIAGNSWQVSDSLSSITASLDSKAEYMKQVSKFAGQAVPELMASGMGESAGDVEYQATRIAQITEILNSNKSNAFTWGADLASNFATGLVSLTGTVADAARSVMQAVAANMKFSVPKDGPFSGAERGGARSGLHLVENFASGMESGIPAVRRAAEEAASAASLHGYGASAMLRASASRPYGGGQVNYYLNNWRVNAEEDMRDITLQQMADLVRYGRM